MRLVYLNVESEYTWRRFFFSGRMHTGGLEKRLVLDNLSVYTPSLEEEEKKEKKELNLQRVFLVPALAEVPGERWHF